MAKIRYKLGSSWISLHPTDVGAAFSTTQNTVDTNGFVLAPNQSNAVWGTNESGVPQWLNGYDLTGYSSTIISANVYSGINVYKWGPVVMIVGYPWTTTTTRSSGATIGTIPQGYRPIILENFVIAAEANTDRHFSVAPATDSSPGVLRFWGPSELPAGDQWFTATWLTQE